ESPGYPPLSDQAFAEAVRVARSIQAVVAGGGGRPTQEDAGMTGQRKVFHLVKSLGRGGAEMLLVEGPASQQGSHSYAFGYLVPWKNALVPELMKRNRRVICFPAASPPAMLAQVPAIAAELKNW